MLRNHLKIALRALMKSRVYSFINIVGLALGMAIAILVGLWIYDELSYDRYHKSYDRIARVMQHQTANGETGTQVSIPFPLGKELQTTYGTSFKYVAMSSWAGGHILSAGDQKLSKTGIYMDVDAPHIFTLKMKYGTRNGLKDPHSILLSESAAKAFFGNANPLEKRLRIDNKLDVKVTGVFEDLPHNTDFRELEFIAPWLLYVDSEDWIKHARDRNQWSNNSFQLFVRIADNTDFATVNKRIGPVKYNHVAPEDRKYKSQLFLHPMSRWHLHSHWDRNGNQTGGQIEYVWLFGMIGIFVLVLACINFMNLSTARSEKRAREVGIRKTIGSLRVQLIGQFFSESILVSLISLVLAILLVELTLPWFNEIAGKKMSVFWANPAFWAAALLFAILTGLLAGSYPALYLSSFQPIRVLKGTFRAGRYASVPRKVLVTLQFTVSVTLIIGTLIVYRQIQYTKNRPVGYSKESLVMLQMKSPDFFEKFEVLRTELKNTGMVVDVAQSSSPLTGIWSSSKGFEWQGKDPGLDARFSTVWVTPEFGKLIGWQMLKGRDFSRQLATDSLSVIINEAGVRFAGLKDPVGTVLKWDDRIFTIVGVVKDLVQESPYNAVSPGLYLLDTNNAEWIILKLNPSQSISASLAKVETVFRRLIPSAPFDFQFVDQAFGEKFANEERVGKLAAFFTSLAIFISSLGLFGLASFLAEQRTKEIGVRKVLGASVFNLWKLLSKDFIGLVLLSCCIAGPLAGYWMTNWLSKFEYRTEISGWIFILAGLGAIGITLTTVSYQTLRAARLDPVKSLKSD